MVITDLHHSTLDRRCCTVDFIQEQAERLAVLREPVRRNPGRFLALYHSVDRLAIHDDFAFFFPFNDLLQTDKVTNVRELRTLKFAAAKVPAVRFGAKLTDNISLTSAMNALDKGSVFGAHLAEQRFGGCDICHVSILVEVFAVLVQFQITSKI
jgi:hypothetical protein